jgi:hypothetical protein
MKIQQIRMAELHRNNKSLILLIKQLTLQVKEEPVQMMLLKLHKVLHTKQDREKQMTTFTIHKEINLKHLMVAK